MELITRSPDLKRLQDEGYEVQIAHGHLIVHSVPYLNSNGELAYGILASTLETNGEQTVYQSGSDHTVYFSGYHPCDASGAELRSIKNASERKELVPGLWVDHRFSAKPQNNYRDYHHKITAYVKILRAPLVDKKIQADACTFRSVGPGDDSPFCFHDTNSARAGTAVVNSRLAGQKIAIIGVGGTGSYILDFVSKTPVLEIHPFDGDVMLSHNAFRAPASPTVEQLRHMMNKAEYHAQVYSRMHSGICAHPYNIDASNILELADMDFVFLCMDGGAAKSSIMAYLAERAIPYLDAGLTLRVTDGRLRGQLRSTLVTPQNSAALKPYIPVNNSGDGNDIYESNAQVAELNALNACLAVLAWKRHNGIYDPLDRPDHTIFKIRNNGIARYEG